MSDPYAPTPDPYAYPQGPGPGSQLVVQLRKPFGLFAASMVSPKLTIDGYPAPARWETNVFPITPGRHQVSASVNYLWEYGRATSDVDIFPGQSAEVHYSPPLLTFVGGKMGPTLQPRPGMVAFWIILAIPVLILVITVLAVVVSAAGS